jgi:two-component system chemotaxis response regulator CheB
MDDASSPGSQTRDLVVIGASAGGVEAIERIVAGLPAGFPAAICVTVHISPDATSVLDQILTRAGPLPARAATDGAPLRPGEILIAPPGHHLLVEDGVARLGVGPRENGHRPAIDVLFRSAARARDGHVVGVVLSGVLDDGAAGLAAIKAAGGAAVVHDPKDTQFPQMPTSAIAATQVDAIAAARQIPDVMDRLVRETIDPRRKIEMHEPTHSPSDDRPVASVCPDCGGLLTEDAEAPILQWACNVGHRYSAASLADAQGSEVEDQIWAVIRSLEDRSKLLQRMADKQQGPGREAAARLLRQRAREAAEHAEVVRQLRQRVTETALQPVLRTSVGLPD